MEFISKKRERDKNITLQTLRINFLHSRITWILTMIEYRRINEYERIKTDLKFIGSCRSFCQFSHLARSSPAFHPIEHTHHLSIGSRHTRCHFHVLYHRAMAVIADYTEYTNQNYYYYYYYFPSPPPFFSFIVLSPSISYPLRISNHIDYLHRMLSRRAVRSLLW